MRAEASQVAMQIKNVSNFIFIYGKIVNSLQIDEDQVKRQETSPEIQATIKKSKAALLTRMRDLRAGLEDLASRFEGNPRLQVQYLKLTYAAEASRDAEDLAARGQYEEAGRSLVTIVERLTDAIISMRLP
jgi:Zn-finger domain-containing protein